jgi:hypothetical protein
MTDTSTQTAPVAVAAPARGGNGAFFAILLAAFALVAAGYAVYQQFYAHPAPAVQGYYVLDLQRLLSAKMAAVLETPGVDGPAEAKRMNADLQRLLQDYGAQGYLVLKRDAVMSVTAEQDITDQVAQKLGIDLSKNVQDVARRVANQVMQNRATAAGPAATKPAGAPEAPPVGAAGPDPYAGLPAEARELFDPPRAKAGQP